MAAQRGTKRTPLRNHSLGVESSSAFAKRSASLPDPTQEVKSRALALGHGVSWHESSLAFN